VSNDKTTQNLMVKLNKSAIEGLQKSIKLIEVAMVKMVNQDANVLRNYNLTLSVRGIGKLTAIFILCCTSILL